MIQLRKLLPYILGAVGAVLLVWFIFSVGKDFGQNRIQTKWDQAVIAKNAEIDRLKEEIRDKERTHQVESERLSNALLQSTNNHSQELAAIQRDFTQRLQQSTQRGQIYERNSQGTATERASLASHAAQLDSSLEEGRQLVKEFGATLRLREDQLRFLGQQIISDRKLFDNGNSTNNESR